MKIYVQIKGNYKLKRESTKDIFSRIDKSKWRYPECL
jgi:hypothetical protein